LMPTNSSRSPGPTRSSTSLSRNASSSARVNLIRWHPAGTAAATATPRRAATRARTGEVERRVPAPGTVVASRATVPRWSRPTARSDDSGAVGLALDAALEAPRQIPIDLWEEPVRVWELERQLDPPAPEQQGVAVAWDRDGVDLGERPRGDHLS